MSTQRNTSRSKDSCCTRRVTIGGVGHSARRTRTARESPKIRRRPTDDDRTRCYTRGDCRSCLCIGSKSLACRTTSGGDGIVVHIIIVRSDPQVSSSSSRSESRRWSSKRNVRRSKDQGWTRRVTVSLKTAVPVQAVPEYTSKSTEPPLLKPPKKLDIDAESEADVPTIIDEEDNAVAVVVVDLITVNDSVPQILVAGLLFASPL